MFIPQSTRNSKQVYPTSIDLDGWQPQCNTYKNLISTSSLRASWVSLIINKTLLKQQESLSTHFTETCVTCPYNLTNGCHLTTAVRSWRQKSRQKIRGNQTRFGMVIEDLSTYAFLFIFIDIIGLLLNEVSLHSGPTLKLCLPYRVTG